MHLQNLLQNGFRIALSTLCASFLLISVAESAASARPSVIYGAAKVSRFHPAPAARSRLLAIVDQSAILSRHQILADAVLRSMPPLCKDSLQNFYVRYDKSNRRGYGGKTSIILDGNVSDTEFVALLVHECGHVIHGNLAGNGSVPSGFKDGMQTFFINSPAAKFFAISWQSENVLRKGTKPEDFASGYAKTNTFEDFSEFLVAYLLHPQYAMSQAKQSTAFLAKLQWMQTNLAPMATPVSYSLAAWNGSIPWDMTKTALVLAPVPNMLTANVR